MTSSSDPKLNKSLIISIIIVVLVFVGVIVASVLLGGEESNPSPVTTGSNGASVTEEDPPWYVEDDTTSSTDNIPTPSKPDSETTNPGETMPTNPTQSNPIKPTTPSVPINPDNPEQPKNPEDSRLSCDRIARFSGRFTEDGSDVPVENIAALLVTNHSEKFLDLANIIYEIDGQKATFIVSGLPAGKSVWVMEYSKISLETDSEVKYVGCTTSFRENVVATSEDVTIRCDGNLLYATNNTDQTLENLFIYYKSLHSDGNYFGGITYMVEFGSIKPGETIDRMGGHFIGEESEIVRIGWQESQNDEGS